MSILAIYFQMRSGVWFLGMMFLFYTVYSANEQNLDRIFQDDKNTVIDKGTVKQLKDTAFKLKRSMQYIQKGVADLKLKKGKFILKKLPMLGLVFDSLDLVFGIIQTFKGDTESPLMKKIRTSFNEINQKLDTITSDLKETGTLIKLATQRAAYIRAENKILTAYKSARLYAKELQQVACTEKTDCTRKKLLIAERFLPRFDVENESDMILRGALSSGAFGQSLLVLTKEITHCDIQKMESTASLIAGLVTKGYIVAMLYKHSTNQSFDKEQYKTEFQRRLISLDRKKNVLTKGCHDNIDRYIRSDVKMKARTYFLQHSIPTANKMLLEFLQRKYFWTRFYVIAVSKPKQKACENIKPVLLTTNRLIQELFTSVMHNDSEIYTFVFIGSYTDAKINIYQKQIFHSAIAEREKVQRMGPWLKLFSPGAVYDIGFYILNPKAVLISRLCQNIVVSYTTGDGTVDLNFGREFKGHKNVTELMYDTGHIVSALALMPTSDDEVRKCSADCGPNGECSFLPYSKQMTCYCSDMFYGDNCESNIMKRTTKAAYSKLLAATSLHIPTRTDLKTELEVAGNRLKSSVGTADARIRMVTGRISRMTADMLGEINTHQEWQGLVTQYSEVLQDIKYYQHVLVNNNSSDTSTGRDEFLKMELESLAKQIMNPDKLEKYLQMVNYLFVGRDSTPLVNHRSLVFVEMERYKADMCSESYKQMLDHAYELLVSLQMQGYMSWLKAHDLLNLDSSHISRDYENLVRRQKKFLDRHTCKVAIPHLANMENCSGGYYIYNGMKNKVTCKNTYYLSGK